MSSDEILIIIRLAIFAILLSLFFVARYRLKNVNKESIKTNKTKKRSFGDIYLIILISLGILFFIFAFLDSEMMTTIIGLILFLLLLAGLGFTNEDLK